MLGRRPPSRMLLLSCGPLLALQDELDVPTAPGDAALGIAAILDAYVKALPRVLALPASSADS